MEIRFEAGIMLRKVKKLLPFTSPISPDINVEVNDNFLVMNSNDQLGSARLISILAQNNITKVLNGMGSLPAHVIVDFLKDMDSDDIVRLNTDSTTLKGSLKSSKNKAQYEITQTADSGTIEHIELTTDPFPINERDLHYILSKIIHITDAQASVAAQNGIYIHPHGDSVRFVAMDNHRIGYFSFPCCMPELVPTLVPVKFLEKILKLLNPLAKDSQVELRSDGTKINVTFGGTVYASPVIDERYPNYNLVLPVGESVKIKIPVDELIKCLIRISKVTSNPGNVTLDITSDTMEVMATNAERGRFGTESLKIESPKDLRLTFNTPDLIEALASFNHGCHLKWYKNFTGVMISSDVEKELHFYLRTLAE